jgi:hypothetical protein
MTKTLATPAMANSSKKEIMSAYELPKITGTKSLATKDNPRYAGKRTKINLFPKS